MHQRVHALSRWGHKKEGQVLASHPFVSSDKSHAAYSKPLQHNYDMIQFIKEEKKAQVRNSHNRRRST